MANKKYTLAAWTDKGRVRMIPSLVNELSVSYRDKIGRLEAYERKPDNEIGWLLSRSRAHEEFARFLMRVGYPKEAYTEYANAAKVCTLCSDDLWVHGDYGYAPPLPLLYRFLAMHRECLKLASEHPALMEVYRESGMEEKYLWYTADMRECRSELKDVLEKQRAWRFGKTS
ncbi:MAG: hypothetical protein IKZ94_02105 [Lachnospiraceae bacterium]|nr:hypothetical protein [Lachnospiraceae bacterium]